jgi:hypothetical protein
LIFEESTGALIMCRSRSCCMVALSAWALASWSAGRALKAASVGAKIVRFGVAFTRLDRLVSSRPFTRILKRPSSVSVSMVSLFAATGGASGAGAAAAGAAGAAAGWAA